MIDPPRPIDTAALGVSAVGTYFVTGPNGVDHLVDVVGESFYPLPTDFAEEVRRYGLSRRLAKTLDFSRLQPGSRILLAHRKAFIANSSEYHAARGGTDIWCPCHIAEHVDPDYTGMCWSLNYEDATGIPAGHPDAPQGMLTAGGVKSDYIGLGMHRRRGEPRSVVRETPTFHYRALMRPPGVTPVYQTAVFLSMPIHRIEIPRDRHGNSHEDALHRARQSKLDVELCEE